MNSLGKRLNYQVNDEIISINGENITGANGTHFFQNFGNTSKPGDALIIKVTRKDVKDVADTLELKSVMTKFPKIKFDVLELAGNSGREQLSIRDAWLKP